MFACLKFVTYICRHFQKQLHSHPTDNTRSKKGLNNRNATGKAGNRILKEIYKFY